MGGKQVRPQQTPAAAPASTAAAPSAAGPSNALQQDLLRGPLAGAIAPEDRAVRPSDVLDLATAVQIEGAQARGPFGGPGAGPQLQGFAGQLNLVAMELTASEGSWNGGEHEASMDMYRSAVLELQVLVVQIMGSGVLGPALLMALDLQSTLARETGALGEAQASILDRVDGGA